MLMPTARPVVQKVHRRPWRADRVGDAGGPGDTGQGAARAGAVRPPAGPGPQDRAGGAPVDGFPHGPQYRDGQRDVGRLGALPSTRSSSKPAAA